MFGVALRTKLRNPGRLRANVPSNDATKLIKLFLEVMEEVDSRASRDRERELMFSIPDKEEQQQK
jgi:hypothetical protein